MICVSVEVLESLRNSIGISSSDLYLRFENYCLMTDVGYALDGIDFLIKILVDNFDVEDIPF